MFLDIVFLKLPKKKVQQILFIEKMIIMSHLKFRKHKSILDTYK